jgi:ribonuclease D
VSTTSEQISLQTLAERARETGKLALDTEFMGEGRYRTLLCLVQLAIPAGGGEGPRTEIVDPLAGELDGGPLAAVIADPAVEVVVHAGRQDVALIRRWLGTDVTNLFDTQVAAGFVGLGAQSSYESLLGDVLDVRVKKTASFTRWDSRPLSEEQLAYAREDVVHLLDLAAGLQRRLEQSGRLAWAREECEPLARASDERDLETIVARLPRVHGLNAPARAVARELVAWRERTAERRDRPVQSVLGDPALMEIARRKPSGKEELGRIRGIGGAASGRAVQELLDAVTRGSESPEPLPPRDRRPLLPGPDDAPLVALAESLLRARAREAGLAYELLAARADLQAIVTARREGGEEADVRTLRGWRRELVGEELLRLLDGEVSLSVRNTADGRRLSVEEQASRG